MDWLNYHHLLYFWTVAREGSVTRAAERLHVAQPTVSSQVRSLERTLGAKLFERSGRNVVLTETGKLAFDYAEEIFATGNELLDVLRGRPTGRPLRLTVGIPDVLPKLVAYRILQPALTLPEPVQLVCLEGKPPELLAELAAHRLDLMLSDVPTGPVTTIRAFNHLLGECPVTVFGTRSLAAAYRRRFPASLADATLLLPTRNTALRRALDQWFDAQQIRPNVAGEFDDSALMNTFGQTGLGLFFASSAIEKDVCRQFSVSRVGRLEAVKERFYAVTPERRIQHPAVLEITRQTREALFASQPPARDQRRAKA